MKPKVSLSSTGNTAADGEVADLQPIDDLGEQEEEKKPMGVGAMVGMVVGGIVLVILLVVGGLWWYVSSSKAADEQKNVQEIIDKQEKARQSIAKTVQIVQQDYEEFHKLTLQGDKAVADAVHEVKKVLPDELQKLAAAVLAPQPLPDIAEAIAYTNNLFAAKAPPPAEEKPTATNSVQTASTDKKTDEKKDEAKKADEKKPEAKKDDKKSKDGDKKGKAEKADKKADGKKAASKKDDDDKDAEAEKAQEEAEAKAEGKEVKKDAKKPEKEEEKEPEEEKKEDSSADRKSVV